MTRFEHIAPNEIEARSFALIKEELTAALDPVLAPVILRVIHTTADFDYRQSLCFSEHVVEQAKDALRNGASIVTDTNMAKAGINKKVLARFGGQVHCYMADEDIAQQAKRQNITRAAASMQKAALLDGPLIFAIGNAPTALMELDALIKAGKLHPALIIGVPVGFVNVVPAKELILEQTVPYIVSRGRKGGSNVAAAICNALLYQL